MTETTPTLADHLRATFEKEAAEHGITVRDAVTESIGVAVVSIALIRAARRRDLVRTVVYSGMLTRAAINRGLRRLHVDHERALHGPRKTTVL